MKRIPSLIKYLPRISTDWYSANLNGIFDPWKRENYYYIFAKKNTLNKVFYNREMTLKRGREN